MKRILPFLALVMVGAAPVAAQTISGCGTTVIAKADANSIPKLTTQADCFGKAKAAAGVAEVTRRERIMAITPVTPPAPPPVPPTPVWTKCADEGGVCYVNGTALVRYGVPGAWTASRTITGFVTCSNAWGDPKPSTFKTCETTATTAPLPPTSTAPLSGIVFEGDSISVMWAGNHTGMYAATRPDVSVKSFAVGGSGIEQMVGRVQAVLDARPKLVSVLIGANDLGCDPTPDTWLNKLSAYLAPIKAMGSKVVVGTILPQSSAVFNACRAKANAVIRTWVGTKIDAVSDFAADSVIGPDVAGSNKALIGDGVHPTEEGHRNLMRVEKPVLDAQYGGEVTQSSTGFIPTATIAPTLAGIEPIASGIKVSELLVPACGNYCKPGFELEGLEGAFRFICAPSHNAYDDPIVYPGQPGKSHLHTFFGNTKADANSNYKSLRTTGDSTCNNILNRSAYWIAAMMNGHGKVVMPNYVSIYYKGTPVGAEACTYSTVKACVKIPRGLRYIFGYNMLDPSNSDPDGMRWWNCDGPGATPGHYRSLKEAVAFCPKGAQVGSIIVGPRCWNGKDLDSLDHRSHMAYLQDDHTGHAPCPATHPYMLPFFQLGAWYTNDGTIADWYLASDRMPGMPALDAGTSLHADWFGAWEDSVLDIWEGFCINKALNCSGGDLGDGQQMKQLKGYDFPNGRPLLDPPPMPSMAGMVH